MLILRILALAALLTSETGNTDRKSQPMNKAGNRTLRTQLIQSANTARQLDPQLAAIYYTSGSTADPNRSHATAANSVDCHK